MGDLESTAKTEEDKQMLRDFDKFVDETLEEAKKEEETANICYSLSLLLISLVALRRK